MHFDLNLAHLAVDPASVVAAWVSLCAAVSLLNKYVVSPMFPMAARIIALPLNILPAHVGQLITDIETIIADIKGGSGGDPSAPALVTPPAPPATSPTTNRMGFAAAGFAGIFAIQTLAFGVATQGCSPAIQAEAKSIEQLVLTDLAAGKTDVQIEADIANLLVGQVGVDAVVLLNDALQLLIDAGVIPPDLMANALSMKASIAPIAEAHRAAK